MVMWDDRLELYIANERNKPVSIPYAAIEPRRAKKQFPKIDSSWIGFVSDDDKKVLGIGVPIEIDGKVEMSVKELVAMYDS